MYPGFPWFLAGGWRDLMLGLDVVKEARRAFAP
jgi:hypothetical protein